jgi:molecular chaperone DnaK (HSP70)
MTEEEKNEAMKQYPNGPGWHYHRRAIIRVKRKNGKVMSSKSRANFVHREYIDENWKHAEYDYTDEQEKLLFDREWSRLREDIDNMVKKGVIKYSDIREIIL